MFKKALILHAPMCLIPRFKAKQKSKTTEESVEKSIRMFAKRNLNKVDEFLHERNFQLIHIFHCALILKLKQFVDNLEEGIMDVEKDYMTILHVKEGDRVGTQRDKSGI